MKRHDKRQKNACSIASFNALLSHFLVTDGRAVSAGATAAIKRCHHASTLTGGSSSSRIHPHLADVTPSSITHHNSCVEDRLQRRRRTDRQRKAALSHVGLYPQHVRPAAHRHGCAHEAVAVLEKEAKTKAAGRGGGGGGGGGGGVIVKMIVIVIRIVVRS